jgi:hypothetical protein
MPKQRQPHVDSACFLLYALLPVKIERLLNRWRFRRPRTRQNEGGASPPGSTREAREREEAVEENSREYQAQWYSEQSARALVSKRMGVTKATD